MGSSDKFRQRVADGFRQELLEDHSVFRGDAGFPYWLRSFAVKLLGATAKFEKAEAKFRKGDPSR